MTVTAKIKIVCGRCKSEDVTRDALASWSVAAQRWELSCEFDNADCAECGETTLEEVEISDEEFEAKRIATMPNGGSI